MNRGRFAGEVPNISPLPIKPGCLSPFPELPQEDTHHVRLKVRCPFFGVGLANIGHGVNFSSARRLGRWVFLLSLKERREPTGYFLVELLPQFIQVCS